MTVGRMKRKPSNGNSGTRSVFFICWRRKKEEVEPAVSKDFVLTAEVIDNQLVDPMIGMENSSPYDFIPAKCLILKMRNS